MLQLQNLLENIVEAIKGKERIVVGIVGIPGAGKSTLSMQVCHKLVETGIKTVVVPMDGFHYSRLELQKLFPKDNGEEAMRRRGAPFTFNAMEFVRKIKELKKAINKEIALPSFDHSVGDPIDNSILVTRDTKVVIVEGLYLALDYEPWSQILSEKLVDEMWWLDLDQKTAEDRLAKRHVEAGICKTVSEAAERIVQNDRENAKHIQDHSQFSHPLLKKQ